jgi:hypothetical protein
MAREDSLVDSWMKAVSSPDHFSRVSVGFVPTYAQPDWVLDWLGTHDLFRAIERTRAAVVCGRIDSSPAASSRKDQVARSSALDAFFEERALARHAYDEFCCSLGNPATCVDGVDVSTALLTLTERVVAAKALDEELHAFITAFNRPDSFVSTLVSRLLHEHPSAASLLVPYPLPSYAIIEGTLMCTIGLLLRDRRGSRGERNDGRQDVLDLLELAGLVEETPLVTNALWVFARGSLPTLGHKLASTGLLGNSAEELLFRRQALVRRWETSLRAYERAEKQVSPELLGTVRLILNLDHVEDALRSAVFNGLEDYITRCTLAEVLTDMGLLPSSDPMAVGQDELVETAQAGLPAKPRMDRRE